MNSTRALVSIVALLATALGIFLGARTDDLDKPGFKEVFRNNDTTYHRIYRIEGYHDAMEDIELPRAASSFCVEWLGEKVQRVDAWGKAIPRVGFINLSSDNQSDLKLSNLCIPSDTFSELTLMTGLQTEPLLVHVFFVPELDLPMPRKLHKAELKCSQPNWISYETWRKGLPDPVSGRVSTDVRHCVIHHSAVLSSDTNYIKRVRNIYIYHTQSNGWDDIGYNFLVAPNGDVFAGRDPQGVSTVDNVMGAHYCAKNSNTMGVCMMGDYSNEYISDTAEGSLIHLLTWKLYKNGLSTYDSFIHPQNTGKYLKSIVGHQDGCATACPGKMLYPNLHLIRNDVQEALDECISVSVKPNKNYAISLYPNPASNSIRVQGSQIESTDYEIVDMNGKVVQKGLFQQDKPIDIQSLPTGDYILRLGNIQLKFMKTFQ